MKKFRLILSVLLLPLLLNAQLFTRAGIRPGLSLAKQNWEMTNVDSDRTMLFRPGLYAGIFTEAPLSDMLSIVGDLGYMQKGNIEKIEKTTIDQPEGTGEYLKMESKFDFISMSIALQLSKQAGNWRPFIFAGPRLDYLLGYTSDLNFDSDEDFSDVNVGLSAGMGTGCRIGKAEISLSGQYQFDFNHFLEKENNGFGLTIDNRAVIISLGCAIVIN